MPIRPIDVRRKEFSNGFRGYDANQVDDFLDAVADEFERTYTENQRMREEVTSLRERLQQSEDLEGSIRAALVHAEQAAGDLRRSAAREADDVRGSAQREAEDTRRSAQREAEITVQDAQARSRRMLADSSSRVERVQGSYEALQEAKRLFTNDFRNLLKTYMDVMENMEMTSAKEIEASLRGRLDTEAIAVAREAAREEDTAAAAAREYDGTATAAGPAPEATDGEDPDLDRTVSGHAVVPSEEAIGAGPVEPVAVETEERSGGEGPVADDLSAADDRSVTDDAATQVLEPVPPGTEGPTEPGPLDPNYPGTEPAEPTAGEPETAEPETEEPEVEPSTAQGQPAEDAASAGPTEPAAAEEVEREEPSLAEQSDSQQFFEQEQGSSRGDSRIFRASRFLRRRGE